MNKFVRFVLITVLVLSLGMFLTACSKSSSSDDGGGGGGTTTNANSTSRQASGSTQASSTSQGSSQTMSNLGSIGLSSMAAPEIKMSNAFTPSPAMKMSMATSQKFAKSAVAIEAASSVKQAISAAKASQLAIQTISSTTRSCAGGGSYTFSGSVDTVTGTYTLNILFTSCRDDSMEFDGTYQLLGTAAGLTNTIGTSGTPFTIYQYAAGGYTTLISKMSANLTLGFAKSTGATITYTMTANGTMQLKDYANNQVYSITFTSLKNVYAFNSGATAISITTDGVFSETWTDSSSVAHTATLTFTAFKITDAVTTSYEDLSLSGTVVVAFSPSTCANGTYTFVTTTPIRVRLSDGLTIAGKIVISGATTITFNADGSVDVSDSSGSQHFASEYDLVNISGCAMGTFDEPAATSSGSSGTATGGFTGTLTWDGATSDMDFHLVHLTATPTGTVNSSSLTSNGATANSNWHLYYGSGPGGGCADSENYSGTAAAKVAVLDIDKCDGIGPEHITMGTPLPAGYYLLYVNQYSMHSDTQTTVTVTLQIGDKLFTAPTHQFTTGTSSANYRAFDISVDASGNATVTSPNAAIVLNAPAVSLAPKF